MLTPTEQQELDELKQLIPELENLHAGLAADTASLDAEIAKITAAGNTELAHISDEADAAEAQAHQMAEEDELTSARDALTPNTTPPNTGL